MLHDKKLFVNFIHEHSTSKMIVSALILAAGKSSRMAHQHKLLLPVGNKPLIAHTVEHVLQARVAEAIVVLGHNADRIRATLLQQPVRFALNENYTLGLSTSIKTGLAACQETSDAVLMCLADQPFVTSVEIDLLISRLEQTPRASIAVPTFKGKQGNPVLFKMCHRQAMHQLTGDVGCKSIIERNRFETLEVAVLNDNVLRDVDTLTEYNALLVQ